MYARSVEHLSEKKKRTVQHAEAQKPSPDSIPVLPQEPPQEAISPAMPFDLSKVDPKKIEIAEEMGIPIKQLIGWASSVEMRFAAIQQNLEDAPQKVVEALKAEALKRQTENAQQMQQQPQAQQGGGLGALAQFLPLLGSGGSNPMQEQMMTKMFEKTMQGMDLSNALTKAMIIKLAPSLAEELTKTIVATGA